MLSAIFSCLDVQIKAKVRAWVWNVRKVNIINVDSVEKSEKKMQITKQNIWLLIVRIPREILNILHVLS